MSETKVVILIKDNSTLVSIGRDKHDPQFFQAKDLPGALTAMPIFLQMAEKKWGIAKLNPETKINLDPVKSAAPYSTTNYSHRVPAKPTAKASANETPTMPGL